MREDSGDDDEMVLDLTEKQSTPTIYSYEFVDEPVGSYRNSYRGHRRRSYHSADSSLNRVIMALAGVFGAIISTHNVILYILMLIVSIFLWPIGVLLFICFICWLWKR